MRSPIAFVLFCLLQSVSPAIDLDDYNIVWDSPSANALESMPCGGGDIGLNVWVENGDLLVYLSRSGTFDELNGMPKLGRLRVKLHPNPFGPEETNFKQKLKLKEGCVELHGSQGTNEVGVNIWVDVYRPVVHISAHSSEPTSIVATYENWRLQPREQGSNEMGANRSYQQAPEPAIIRPDTVEFSADTVRFYHRNTGRTAFDMVVEQQGLETVKNSLWNPLKNLTFGGELSGVGFTSAGTVEGKYASTRYKGWRLQSDEPRLHHELQLTLHVAQTQTLDEWNHRTIGDLSSCCSGCGRNT